jgi:RNA polymerase sigma-70 factor (ECF subfamily)
VRVNRAVAVAEVAGPRAGLDLLDDLVGTPTERWHLYWSTRADFLRRLDHHAAAADAYRRALACPSNDSDRRFLERRLAALEPHRS